MPMNKRLELPGPKRPLEIVEKTIPEAPENGLVLKVHYAGICHSDVHAWDNEISIGNGQTIKQTDFKEYVYPIVLGHEISGEIYELGKKADSCDLKVGDHVMVYPWGGCRKCGHCTCGKSSRCEKTFEYSVGFCIEGGYQQYVVVSGADLVVKVPGGLPMDTAAMLPCSGITAFNAISTAKEEIDKSAQALGGASLLIVGAGGLGLWGIQIAKALLPKTTTVIVAEVSEAKLEQAKDAGADKTVLMDMKGTPEENAERIIAVAKGRVHAVVDFVNNSSSAATVYGCLQRFAKWVMVGLYGGSFEVPLPLIPLEGTTITGICYGDISHLENLAKIAGEGKVKAPKVKHVTLDKAQGVLDLLKAGKMNGRGIIKFV